MFLACHKSAMVEVGKRDLLRNAVYNSLQSHLIPTCILYKLFSWHLIYYQFQVTMMQLKDYHLLNIFPQRVYKKELVYILPKNVLFVLQQESKHVKANLNNCDAHPDK